MKKFIFAVVCAGALAACETQERVTLKPDPGASAEEALIAVVMPRAIARSLANYCPGNKYEQVESFSRGANRDLRNLTKQGYSRRELEVTLLRLKRPGRVAEIVEEQKPYLLSQGYREGDPQSACTVIEKEMTADTAIGRLLKRT